MVEEQKTSYSLEVLSKAIKGKWFPSILRKEVPYKCISIDTRTLKKGDLFFAIRGQSSDGHDFLRTAERLGCVGCVVDEKHFNSMSLVEKKELEGISFIVVKDTVSALQSLGLFFRAQFSGICIGITGSCGKTTTKEVLSYLLNIEWNLLVSKGNQNNYLGLPITLSKLEENHQIILAELGASYLGEIGELSEILQPNAGIITNVHPCHLEGFETLENIYQTKSELAKKVFENEGKVVVNGDDDRLLDSVKGHKGSVITFGVKPHNDFKISSVRTVGQKTTFLVNDQYLFEIKTLAQFNVMNVVAAIALALSFGLEMSKIQNGLKSFEFPEQRYQVIDLPKGITFVHDAYNSNPMSFRLAVESFEGIEQGARKIVVCGDMKELGEKEEEYHQSLGETFALKPIDVFVTVGPLMKILAKGIRSNSDARSIVYSFDTNEEVSQFLESFIRTGDWVLFKGSRSMKLEEVIQCFMHSYTH